MTSEINKFINLMCQVDNIEGHTADGRVFSATYENTKDPNNYLQIKIFDDGNVFERILQVREVVNYNLLSLINRMEKDFFTNRKPTKVERKNIQIHGNKDGNVFKINVDVENTRIITSLDYLGQFVSLHLRTNTPEYISHSQKHHWLYLHYQKPESWIDILKYNIKDIWYQCCGHSINGNYNYCHFCGKKQEVNGIEIRDVVAEELLTKLV